MRTRPTSEVCLHMSWPLVAHAVKEDPTPTAVSVAKRRSRVDLMHCGMEH
jgi:hypothetical protein